MSTLSLVRPLPIRNYLVTNLSNGEQTLCGMPNGEGAPQVMDLMCGTDYDTCMGEAFFLVMGDQHTCTPLTQGEAAQWCAEQVVT